MSFSHDALVKRIFSNPENARGLLAAALPPALSQRIDWTALALEPGSFVDDELKGRHTDLLFSARIGTSDALLYLLLEHQSSEDPLMAFRLLRYMVRIWDRWLERHVGARTLPPIIPLVLHQSDRPWRAPTHLEALIDLTRKIGRSWPSGSPAISFGSMI